MALREREHFNALDAYCATEMAVWIGFGRYENKGIIKTLLWLNLLENLKLGIVSEKQKRIGGLCPART